ncbi:MAG: type II toxin-antitoxin system VapC family toxin, partial [Micrococcales bacterium]|nr:type II toxin-antitoxin system VapC family toxin [Micrococcales bacterium]
MIIDTSALVAILRDEPSARQLDHLLWHSRNLAISAANYVELGAVADRDPDVAQRRRAGTIIDDYGISISPVTAEQARIAREAYRDFGRGSGHPAHLNFGDAFSYALASVTGEPLL